jgi:hypothetical protein
MTDSTHIASTSQQNRRRRARRAAPLELGIDLLQHAGRRRWSRPDLWLISPSLVHLEALAKEQGELRLREVGINGSRSASVRDLQSALAQ